MSKEIRSSEHAEAPIQTHEIRDVQQTTCIVVGAGPAGAVLSFMLARQGIDVLLLESHMDFDRDFRGDTLHPSILEVMDELGLADRLLQLPHTEMSLVAPPAAAGSGLQFDLHDLKTKFPYIAMMPQARFLAFITGEAQRFPSYRLLMGARVEELIEEDGQVRGVRYRAHDGWHEVRALLVVGTDGRFSRLRKLAGFEPIASSPPMDVLWLRLSRWYRPGLLLLGDAAHVMSPAGGNGINYAIMDAVAAANLLTAPLQAGRVTVADLARVQRRREWPTRVVQAIVNFMQDSLLKAALDPTGSFTFPSFLGWPLLRKVPPLLFGFGIRPEHVQTETRRGHTQARMGKWGAVLIVTLVVGWVIRRLLRRF
jgi:2-polyprenyl-6-methoxyphenol hydroxylase-like FAD-dependent oxidoreductase